MPSFSNSHGLQFAAQGPDAVAAFDRTVMNYLSFNTHTGASLKAMLALDPEMPMAQCLRGYFFMLMGVGTLVGKAGQDAFRLQDRQQQLSEREGLHAQALSAWVTQSLGHATRIWQEIAERWPRDILALKMAHFGHFYCGNARAIRDTAAAALDHWNVSEDAQPYLQTMYAFGLEECGEAARAESLAKEALARQPDDAWGIHAVAHALEATGRTAEGIAWIDSRATYWNAINNFRYHVAWHKALFRFESGDYEQALREFDGIVFAESANEYLDICNDASMLMRLELAGADVGGRWTAVAVKAASRTEERLMPFADLHYVMALASSTDPAHRELARRLSGMLQSRAAKDMADADAWTAAASAARGIVALREGAYDTAASDLQQALPHLHRVGGSHAQRELFNTLVAESMWRGGRETPQALALFAGRSHSHPHNRRNWAMYLQALEARGATQVLEAARRRMAQLH